jgi:hypothetical protein
MITMLHYDAVYSPPVIPAETKKRGQVTSQAQHLAYLEQHPYETYSQDKLAQVCTFFPQTKEHSASRCDMIIMDIVHYLFDEHYVVGFGFSV